MIICVSKVEMSMFASLRLVNSVVDISVACVEFLSKKIKTVQFSSPALSERVIIFKSGIFLEKTSLRETFYH